MKQTAPFHRKNAGYVLIEIIIALGLFATVAVSLTKALHVTSRTAHTIQDEMAIGQILQSALIDALSNPDLEEGVFSVPLTDITGDEESFFAGEVETLVEPLELENDNGELLPGMFLIRVTFYWTFENEEHQQSAETWRYNRLYQP